MMLNVFSAFAQQVGFQLEEKGIWNEMDEWVERVSKTERLVIEADLSGLVDEGNTTDEVLDWRVMQKDRWQWILPKGWK